MISVTVYKDGPVLIQNGNTLLRAHNVTDADHPSPIHLERIPERASPRNLHAYQCRDKRGREHSMDDLSAGGAPIRKRRVHMQGIGIPRQAGEFVNL